MLTNLYVKTVVALEQFRKDERGVTAIEYALVAVAIAGIVAAVFIAGDGADGAGSLKAALEGAFENISEQIDSVSADTSE